MNLAHNADFDRLCSALLHIQTMEECRDFLEDICTIKEIMDISQRLKVAEMLRQGKNYAEISGKTGASTATICRVNKCVMYGTGGYDVVLARMKEEEPDAMG